MKIVDFPFNFILLAQCAIVIFSQVLCMPFSIFQTEVVVLYMRIVIAGNFIKKQTAQMNRSVCFLVTNKPRFKILFCLFTVVQEEIVSFIESNRNRDVFCWCCNIKLFSWINSKVKYPTKNELCNKALPNGNVFCMKVLEWRKTSDSRSTQLLIVRFTCVWVLKCYPFCI